jgi:hypothetical protein
MFEIPGGKAISGLFHLNWLSIVLVIAFLVIGGQFTQTFMRGARSSRGDEGYGIWKVAAFLGLFLVFIVALLAVLWVATHFINCKQPQCTIICLAALIILTGIFLFVVAFVIKPLSTQPADVTIKVGDHEIGAKGLSISIIVVGFSALLAVGYLIPC